MKSSRRRTPTRTSVTASAWKGRLSSTEEQFPEEVGRPENVENRPGAPFGGSDELYQSFLQREEGIAGVALPEDRLSPQETMLLHSPGDLPGLPPP